jgi:hypothetical protein
MKPAAGCAATLAIAASVILAAGAAAQGPADPSTKRVVAPPRTSGQAPRDIHSPIGHRQPAAKDVPPEVNEAAPNPANRQIDRRLNICRGC